MKFSCKVQLTPNNPTNNTYPFLDCLIETENEKITNQSILKENTHRTMHALYIRSTTTLDKNAGKKSKCCL